MQKKIINRSSNDAKFEACPFENSGHNPLLLTSHSSHLLINLMPCSDSIHAFDGLSRFSLHLGAYLMHGHDLRLLWTLLVSLHIIVHCRDHNKDYQRSRLPTWGPTIKQ